MLASEATGWLCCSWKWLRRPQGVTRTGGADNCHRATRRQKSLCLRRDGAQARSSLELDVAELYPEVDFLFGRDDRADICLYRGAERMREQSSLSQRVLAI